MIEFSRLGAITAVVVPVFLAAALGFTWKKRGLPYDIRFVTTFVVNVATPCLVFSTLSGLRFEGDRLAVMAGASAVTLLGSILAGLGLLWIARLPLRPFAPALAFPNAGNLGLPVCLFAFGEAGLAHAIVFFTILALLQFTAGPAIAAGRVDSAQILRMPLIYAVLCALAVMAFQVPVPPWLAKTTRLLGGCAVPLMLVSLGVALAGLRPGHSGAVLTVSCLRLTLGFAIDWAVAELFRLDGVMRGVLLVQSTMPAAVFNYLWAERYGSAPDQVAGVVVGSTALGFLLLPALLAAAMP